MLAAARNRGNPAPSKAPNITFTCVDGHEVTISFNEQSRDPFLHADGVRYQVHQARVYVTRKPIITPLTINDARFAGFLADIKPTPHHARFSTHNGLDILMRIPVETWFGQLIEHIYLIINPNHVDRPVALKHALWENAPPERQ